MKGFDDDWLTLREPFDHACRNREVLSALLGWAAGRKELHVLDLGGGTGSNFRFLAPRLGIAHQNWVIVDHDPVLLANVAHRIRPWAAALECEVAGSGSNLVVMGPADRWTVDVKRLDLAHCDGLPTFENIDLVTASALLDLVSAQWVERVMPRIVAAGIGQYWALTYDGWISWTPEDPGDEAARGLVNRHQRTDKGFGPALGPSAVEHLAEDLAALGGHIVRGRSNWSIGPYDRRMQHRLLDGFVGAALEISPCSTTSVRRWMTKRAAFIDEGRSHLTVGHEDLFAY